MGPTASSEYLEGILICLKYNRITFTIMIVGEKPKEMTRNTYVDR
jgi:hypothetical protein